MMIKNHQNSARLLIASTTIQMVKTRPMKGRRRTLWGSAYAAPSVTRSSADAHRLRVAAELCGQKLALARREPRPALESGEPRVGVDAAELERPQPAHGRGEQVVGAGVADAAVNGLVPDLLEACEPAKLLRELGRRLRDQFLELPRDLFRKD